MYFLPLPQGQGSFRPTFLMCLGAGARVNPGHTTFEYRFTMLRCYRSRTEATMRYHNRMSEKTPTEGGSPTRSGEDRRSSTERRKEDRRVSEIPVEHDRRSDLDRRQRGDRRSGRDRRKK